MRALQSILLATDLLPGSGEVAQTAALLAGQFGSRVTLMHVLEPPPKHAPEVPGSYRQHIVDSLEQLAGQFSERNTIADVIIVQGTPASAIAHKACEIDADLILLGLGRQTLPDHFSVGPTAQMIVEHAPQPVLVVGGAAPAAQFHRILCPVDHSEASRRGLANAVRLAQAFGGELVVLTVVPAVNWLSAAVVTGELADSRAKYDRKWLDEFEHFVQRVPFAQVRWTQQVRHGDPAEEITAAAAANRADVIVMGVSGKSGLERMFGGSVLRRLLRAVPCSLLVVKQEDVVSEWLEDAMKAVKVLMAQGQGLLGVQSYSAAATKFRQAINHNPFHAEALEGLSAALQGLGQTEEAEFYQKKARILRAHDWG